MADPTKSKNFFSTVAEFREAILHEEQRFVYGRGAHPTVERANQALARLDGREAALAFASGVGAVSALFCSVLKSGDHLVLNRSSYSWTKHLVEHHLVNWGIEVTWVEDRALGNAEEIRSAFKPNTRLVYLEVPTYFIFDVPDVMPCLREARARGILTGFDNTFSGPANYKLASEFDFAIYSGTKIVIGNGRDLGGFITCSQKLRELVFKEGLMSLGAVMAWRVAEEAVKGIENYTARTEAIARETRAFIEGLDGLNRVRKIHSPWVQGRRFAPHADFHFPVGLLSLELDVDSISEMESVCDRFKVFKMAVSYGAPEALAVPACLFQKEGQPSAHPPGLVRLSLGEQKAKDLLEDLRQAVGC